MFLMTVNGILYKKKLSIFQLDVNNSIKFLFFYIELMFGKGRQDRKSYFMVHVLTGI